VILQDSALGCLWAGKGGDGALWGVREAAFLGLAEDLDPRRRQGRPDGWSEAPGSQIGQAGTAVIYRRLAEDCRAAARSVSTDDVRAALLAQAEYWQRLAEQQEDESADVAVPPADAEPPQPVMQQQQQPQPDKREDESE
jgi:hypothetical protein